MIYLLDPLQAPSPATGGAPKIRSYDRHPAQPHSLKNHEGLHVVSGCRC